MYRNCRFCVARSSSRIVGYLVYQNQCLGPEKMESFHQEKQHPEKSLHAGCCDWSDYWNCNFSVPLWTFHVCMSTRKEKNYSYFEIPAFWQLQDLCRDNLSKDNSKLHAKDWETHFPLRVSLLLSFLMRYFLTAVSVLIPVPAGLYAPLLAAGKVPDLKIPYHISQEVHWEELSVNLST